MNDFDANADTYTRQVEDAISFAGQEHDFFIEVKARALRDRLARHPSGTSAAVLDVGCGIGLIHPKLAGRIGTLTGTDVSRQSLEEARRRNPGTPYLHYDGQSLPFADASFDLAFASCVLHHVPVAQWPGFLAEMRRVVRPGGQVAIIEHNPLNPLTQLVVSRCAFDDDATLVWPRRCAALMRAAGLTALDTGYLLFTPFRAAWVRRTEDRMKRLPLGAQYVMVGHVPA